VRPFGCEPGHVALPLLAQPSQIAVTFRLQDAGLADAHSVEPTFPGKPANLIGEPARPGHDSIGCRRTREYKMTDLRLALKITLVGLLVILIVGRLALHITLTFLLPLLILLAVFFVVFVLGVRLLFRR
jgi:hypothetical protein